MRISNFLFAACLVAMPSMASAVTVDIVSASAARNVTASSVTLGAGFDPIDPADVSATPMTLGTNLGVNTPYDWDVNIDAFSGSSFNPANDYSGSLDFSFVMDIAGPAAANLIEATLNETASLAGLTLQWFAGDGVTTLSAAQSLVNSTANLITSNLNDGDIAILRVAWTGFGFDSGKVIDLTPNIDFTVEAVPLPASLLLLLGALGGLGLIGRRRNAIAA